MAGWPATESAEVPAEPKSKRKVGLATALGLMLVASIGTGVLTAATVGKPSHVTHDYNALNEKSVPRAENLPAGSVEAVAQRVLPSVVSIQVSSRRGSGEGSGSIISSDGQVLTNHHVVGDAKNGGLIEVTLNDGSVHPADYVASDASTDIAVIKIRDVQGLPVLKFGDSSQVAVGQEVVAIGSPLGLSATVTSGIVSALNRPVRASGGEGGESSLIDAIQTDAAINPGNSGGPLVDMEGNLIGMNSVIASLSSGSSGQSGSIGLGFAIPANQAKRIAQQLVETGQVKQPVIGVKVSQSSEYRGALVAEVDPKSPAGQAGVSRGDLVTKVNDRVIDNADALIAAVRSQEFGQTITLEIMKPDTKETHTIQVTLPPQ
nr:trypsin-like peptidase domain-containing protein [Corynebacterium epidermidicanis]